MNIECFLLCYDEEVIIGRIKGFFGVYVYIGVVYIDSKVIFDCCVVCIF